MDLFQHSVHVITAHQAPTGAYVASPHFPVYRYSWFRDGAFIAYAMDLAGQHGSARSFHDWAIRTILRHARKAERAIEKAARSEPLGQDYLHTRYTLEGEEGPEGWPDFQLDGFGTWLWALSEHVQRTGVSLTPDGQAAVALAARYLSALWARPCYDLWEEHPHYQHPYTLAAIYAGLRAAGTLLGAEGHALIEVAEQVRRFVLTHGVQEGRLVKYIPPAPDPAYRIDASLVGVATPYRLLPPEDPLMRATVASIERELRCPGGGVHRYRADTYYGGGEWVLLAAWLGWYYMEVAEIQRARELLDWVEAQADAEGHLPEQVSGHLLAPERYGEWEARWGPVAKPLLWSHAKYLILRCALQST
ncbi:glycoside hydrolase family 15 protein [Thermoflexus sp.]|uniref:glycoside hydrolase family 15 protein n=1 Tax=Thermoflexus sp. TaxID=1969742 RepID=UPI0035E42ABF